MLCCCLVPHASASQVAQAKSACRPMQQQGCCHAKHSHGPSQKSPERGPECPCKQHPTYLTSSLATPVLQSASDFGWPTLNGVLSTHIVAISAGDDSVLCC